MTTTRLLAALAAITLLAAAALAWAPARPLALQPDDETEAPAASDPQAQPEGDETADPAPPDATDGDTTDSDLDRIAEDLERAADRAADTRIAPPTIPAAGSRLLREGTFLRSRRGRVVRDESGEWIFRFDSDGESTVTDPPMVLMPCQALMAMEAIAQRHGDAATFTVSGEVYVYHNRNYLLPKMYVVNRATDEVIPGQ